MNIFDETLVIVVESPNVGGVYSVNGKAGYVTLDKSDIGLSNVENISIIIGTGAGEVAAGDHTHELTDLDATGATNGHVLTADGSGGASFAAAGGGGAPKAFSREPTDGSISGLVIWADSGFDTTGGFDVANNRFIVPIGDAGLYAFNAAIFYELPSDTQVELGIYVNDSRVRAFYTGTFDGVQGQAQVFGIVSLNEGDIVTVRVNFFGDEYAFIRNDNGTSWFTGVKL